MMATFSTVEHRPAQGDTIGLNDPLANRLGEAAIAALQTRATNLLIRFSHSPRLHSRTASSTRRSVPPTATVAWSRGRDRVSEALARAQAALGRR
jgi:hypothetical protein